MEEDLKEKEDLNVEEISSTVSLNGCGVAPRKMRTVARVLKNRRRKFSDRYILKN